LEEHITIFTAENQLSKTLAPTQPDYQDAGGMNLQATETRNMDPVMRKAIELKLHPTV
jgi:hypothetical protein